MYPALLLLASVGENAAAMTRTLRWSFFVALFAVANLSAQDVKWWDKDLAAALVAANDCKTRLVLLYCFAKDPDCESMWADTMTEKSLQPMLLDLVCMGAAREDAAGKELIERYRVVRMPTVLFLQPDGAVVDLIAGYTTAQPFKDELVRIVAGKDTIAALRAGIQKAPNDLGQQLLLAKKLRAIGDLQGAAETVAAIVAKDPKAKTEGGAEAQLLQLCEQAFKPEITPQDYDLRPLKEFLVKQRNKRILFLGYDRLAAVEDLRENLKEACEAVARAWKNIPPEELPDWGQRIAGKAYKRFKDLDKNQLKLALEISTRSLAAIEAECKKTPDDVRLANALYMQAAIQIVNNQRKECFASMERAMQLNPKDENFGKALARWKSGEK